MAKSKTQPTKAVVAAVAKVAGTVGGSFVYASSDRSFLKEENASAFIAKHEFASCVCGSCGHEFLANVEMASPFCTLCGHEDVKSVAKASAKSTAFAGKDEDLIAISCASCKATNTMNQSVAKASSGHLHCAACGSELAGVHIADLDALPDVIEDEDETDEVTVDDLEELSMDDEDLEEADAPASPNPAKKDAPVMDKPDTPIDGNPNDAHDSLPTEGMEKAPAAPSPAKKDAPVMDKPDTPIDGNPNDAHGELPKTAMASKKRKAAKADGDPLPTLDIPDAPAPDVAIDAHDSLPETVMAEGEEIEMADIVEDDLEAASDDGDDDDDSAEEAGDDDTYEQDKRGEESSVVRHNGKILLMKGDHAIAKLTEETAGKNADIFYNAAFDRALNESVASHGLLATAKAFGFESIKVKVNVKSHVAKLVGTRVAAETASLAKTKETVAETFKECLEIAATGLNQGFFKKVENPLRVALISELATVGVRRPEKIVAKLFNDHGMEYVAVLIEQAKAVMARSQSGRDEIASILNMSSDTEMQEDADFDGDGDEDDMLDMASAISPAKHARETAALLDSKTIESIRLKLPGGRLFGSV